ncbi:MAG: hypothetical protein GY859_42450, partial [Desulfobacterales bacterium]|nr:hypothetical protein [Desulfobacterales bacterium]
ISRETIKKKYSGKYAKNVAYFASDSSLGYEYPPLSEKNVKAILAKGNPFSYKKLLRYAFAASHAYSIEKGAEPFSFRDNKNFKELMTPGGSGELAIIDTFKGRSGLYAAALDAPAVAGAGLDREIIIAYKGTSNIGDGIQDMKLMFTNFFESDTDWQRDAYDFCKRIIADYPPNERSLAGGYAKPRAAKTYNVVFTGHSLGGYTAIDAGVRTGVLTRVFSSPATRIIEKYVELFANKMRLNNVINFIRDGDPVATMSGRHDENMVYFPPGNFEMDPFRSHYLSPFITKVLEPLSQRPDDARSIPTHVYITPDTFVGAGLNSRINCWGRFKP